ncbi:MAG TPA: SprT family zinc-dependent metalloprotease [Acidobacteriota bacterium]|nr:SprT family zinc-dependent metalloprotease [Acidobacteriota bacterium]
MITEDCIQFGSTTINYDIVYSDKRKNATLAVYPMKEVEIRVPKHLEQEHIQRLVKKKADWVIKQLLWFDEITRLDSSKEHVNGETYLYLGRQFRLQVKKAEGRAEAKIIGRNIGVNLPINTPKKYEKKIIKAAIWKFYRQQTEEKVEELVKKYSKRLGIEPPKFMIKNQYKRWGSCTSKNLLIFNFRLSMAPVSQVEHVVAHEICHIKVKDHSSEYWKQLKSILPEYEVRKDAIKKDGWQYVL